MKATLASVGILLCSLLPGSAVDYTKEQAGEITQVVGALLQRAHLRQVPLDQEMASDFLENYLDTLDANRMIFLQSDIDEFKAEFGEALSTATLQGNVEAAFVIFKRYVKRLEARHQYITEKLLKKEYDFTREETFVPDRDDASWPEDKAAAEALWHDRIKNEFLQGQLAGDDRKTVKERIQKRYDRLLQVMSKYEVEEKLESYLTALAQAYDPHSAYLSPTEAKNFEINNIDLSLTGIGARLTWEDGYTKIVSLVPGGPASKSGELSPNDRIVAVAQEGKEPVDVVGRKLRDVVSMIRGPIGKKVRLTIIPAEAADGSVRKEVTIVRDKIELKEQYAKAKVIEKTDSKSEDGRLGVIDLPKFYENCAEDTKTLLKRLKKEGVNGIVLDLRHNSGGILSEAVDLAGLFIDEGPVVQYQDYREQTTVLRDDNAGISYDGPLVVLVGKLSASASEIVAACLQDYGRAIVVGGESTHGKGTVQTVLTLNKFVSPVKVKKPGRLKFTVSKFYRVAGSTTQRQGVTPDIVLPSGFDYLELGEASLDNSLPADRIAKLEYDNMDRVKPYVEELRGRSETRVANSKAFDFVRKDIQLIKERQANKAVSLQKEARLKKKEEREALAEKREKFEEKVKLLDDLDLFKLTLDMAKKEEPLEPIELPESDTEKEEGKEKEGESTEEGEKSDDTSDGAGAADDSSDEAGAAGRISLSDRRNRPVDPHLDESLNILWDYIELAKKQQAPFLAETGVESANDLGGEQP